MNRVSVGLCATAVAGLVFLGLAANRGQTPPKEKTMTEEQKTLSENTSQGEGHKALPKTPDEWKKTLTPEQFWVTRMKGTERPFTGEYYKVDKQGVYRCVCCGAVLFSSENQFEAGCGWPSFWKAVDQGNIKTLEDHSHGMHRIEVQCKNCGAHLGHLFDDGPKPTGMRFCINSVALKLDEKKPAVHDTQPAGVQGAKRSKATFGGGCFWGVESAFQQVKGVVATHVGYEGGRLASPTYRDVCTHTTGHAEVVQVEYDPAKVSYEKLLEVFWAIHDPTTKDRQGPDVGSNYRSVIFYHSPEQQAAALALKEKLQKSGKYKRPIVTEIVPATTFWLAEDYHQQYFQKNGLPSCHTVPAELLK